MARLRPDRKAKKTTELGLCCNASTLRGQARSVLTGLLVLAYGVGRSKVAWKQTASANLLPCSQASTAATVPKPKISKRKSKGGWLELRALAQKLERVRVDEPVNGFG